MENTDALLVFGSTTGTTRLLAGAVKKGLQNHGLHVKAKNVVRTRCDELPRYSLLFMGCSTWENGAIQRDFQTFLANLGSMRLDGAKAAVFGPGSRSYPHFCRAVDLLETELVSRGAQLLSPSLRIDGSGYSMRGIAQEWAEHIADHLI
jgi:flavodoxin I